MARRVIILSFTLVLALAGRAVAQPVWGYVGISATVRSEAFADDPFDLDPPCSVINNASTIIPGFLGNNYGMEGYAGCGLLIVTCPLAGVGHARIEINGLNSDTLYIKWKVLAWTYHNCDMRDGYIASGLADLLSTVSVTAVNVPPGTPVTVDYKLDATSYNRFFAENGNEDDGYVKDTQLDINAGGILGGGFDWLNVVGTKRLADKRGVLPLIAGSPLDVTIGGEAFSLIQLPGIFAVQLDFGRALFEGELVLSLNGPPAPTYPGGTGPAGGPASTRLLFGLDLGSDAEIGDANLTGNTLFDPGDAYLWRGAALPLTGANGVLDDDAAFPGPDPNPKPPFPPLTGPPYCSGVVPTPGFIVPWFDMDDFDSLGTDLRSILPPYPIAAAAPIARFSSDCIFPAKILLVSFDDDTPTHWAGPPCSLPTNTPSPIGATYGNTGANDEIVEVTLLPSSPTYFLGTVTGVADEENVHLSLAPNPNGIDDFDDDIDSLDAYDTSATCNFWYFSADHEAAYDAFGGAASLNPGVIYLAVAGSPPVPIVNPVTHLGLPVGVDIDAFEFVWLYRSGGEVLGIIFSVNDDDPLTPDIESGGLDPRMIYASDLTGTSFPLLNFALQDDIDAITAFRASFVPITPPGPCPGDANSDRLVNAADLSVLLSQFNQFILVCSGADFNCDGIVNAADLSVLLSNFGNVCP